MSGNFAEIEQLEKEIGMEAVLLVLDVLGGAAGQTRYIPSAASWREFAVRRDRDKKILQRFEILLREESSVGPGYTLRAYRAIASESGMSVRQVQRIVARKG